MVTTPALRTGLLDFAAAAGFAGPVLMVLSSYDSRDVRFTVAVAALVVFQAIIWVLWRRSGQRSTVLAVAFAVGAALTMMLGNGVLFYGIVWAACLVLSVSFSTWPVLWGYAAALTALTLALHLWSGSAAERTFAETVATAVLTGIAAATGGVLRDSLRVGDALQTALAERDAANAELRRRLGTDRELVLAQERERMARELHDDLGHRLTALGMSIDFVARTPDTRAAGEELDRARGQIGESLASMRSLVRAMHPIELGELRDADALRAVAATFRGTGLDIRVAVDGDGAPLPHDVSLLLLRFVQEGLANVVRHSDAASADLDVRVGASSIGAVLTDAGGAADGPVVEGFGLRSLRERARDLGGDVRAERCDDGFRLAVEVPLVQAAPHRAPAAAGAR